LTPAVRVRRAERRDLPAILALLVDDDLGTLREEVESPVHALAFETIAADPNQLLAVAESAGDVLGCFQLTFIPGLSRQGAWRGQIEAVRVARDSRGRGIGKSMMSWAIEQCRVRHCKLLQLTSDKRRTDAHRFYRSMGFAASHEGLKLNL
jgi:ribosomal protein S18 acetylase RimI-like enzyme